MIVQHCVERRLRGEIRITRKMGRVYSNKQVDYENVL